MLARSSVIGILFAILAHFPTLAWTDEPGLDAALLALDAFVDAQREPASVEAFAALRAAKQLFRETVAKSREQTPAAFAADFDASVSRDVADALTFARGDKTADYRCFTVARRLLESSQSMVVLPFRLKAMDAGHLDSAKEQYTELLHRFQDRLGAAPDGAQADRPTPLISGVLHKARSDLFAPGFGILLSPSQRAEFEALLDDQASQLRAAAAKEPASLSAVERLEEYLALNKGWTRARDFLDHLENCFPATAIGAPMASFMWDRDHRKLRQAVQEGVERASVVELEAIRAAAERDAAQPDGPPEVAPPAVGTGSR